MPRRRRLSEFTRRSFIAICGSNGGVCCRERSNGRIKRPRGTCSIGEGRMSCPHGTHNRQTATMMLRSASARGIFSHSILLVLTQHAFRTHRAPPAMRSLFQALVSNSAGARFLCVGKPSKPPNAAREKIPRWERAVKSNQPTTTRTKKYSVMRDASFTAV